MSKAFKAYKEPLEQGPSDLARRVMENERRRHMDSWNAPKQTQRRDTPEIRAMLAAGEGYKIVAARFNLGLTSIFRTAKDMGIIRRPK
jgi:hypothetical protein